MAFCAFYAPILQEIMITHVIDSYFCLTNQVLVIFMTLYCEKYYNIFDFSV